MKILLVEDDKSLGELLAEYLTQENYAVDVATDGESAWQYGSSFVYDLILLDVLLPKIDGISLCRQFRDRGCRTPILLLTARNSSTDKIKGLDAGADDYLVKPFDFDELSARIRALLRRDTQTLPPVLQWDSLCLNPSTCEVTYAERSLRLTPKEYALLELFLRNQHRVYSPSEIIDRVWSSQEAPGEDTVRTHIKELRRKLKAVGAPGDSIKTVYGQGYCLKSPIKKQERPEEKEKKLQKDVYLAAMMETWEQCKEEIVARLEILERAATLLETDTLDPEIEQQAKFQAHSLAGTLGTFGFAAGSRLAREIETWLQTRVRSPQNGENSLSLLLRALREEMDKKPTIETFELAREESPLLLIVGDDSAFARELSKVAKIYGIRTATSSISDFQLFLAQKHPDVILFKLEFERNSQIARSMQSIASLGDREPSLPIIVIADRGNLEDRIAAIARGVRIFLEQPVTPDRAIAAVGQVLGKNHIGAKVMIVDDDMQLLKALPAMLEPWGLKPIALEDPRQFWDVLKAVEPDLLVLDIEMPYIDGIQLCRVLRSDPLWNQLPVLFLSVRSDSETQKLIFASGADDYVTKPVIATELATRILNRLERARIMAKIEATG